MRGNVYPDIAPKSPSANKKARVLAGGDFSWRSGAVSCQNSLAVHNDTCHKTIHTRSRYPEVCPCAGGGGVPSALERVFPRLSRQRILLSLVGLLPRAFPLETCSFPFRNWLPAAKVLADLPRCFRIDRHCLRRPDDPEADFLFALSLRPFRGNVGVSDAPGIRTSDWKALQRPRMVSFRHASVDGGSLSTVSSAAEDRQSACCCDLSFGFRIFGSLAWLRRHRGRKPLGGNMLLPHRPGLCGNLARGVSP